MIAKARKDGELVMSLRTATFLLVVHSTLVVPAILFASTKLMDGRIKDHASAGVHNGALTIERFNDAMATREKSRERIDNMLIDTLKGVQEELRELRSSK